MKAILLRPLKPLLKFLLVIISIIAIFLIASLVLSAITVKRVSPFNASQPSKTIYIHSNGVHVDIAIKKADASAELLQDLQLLVPSDYLSFGWGEENFYLNTPTWGDLTANTAITALFVKSPALMHVTYYQQPTDDWIAIPVSTTEFNKVTHYLEQSFMTDNNNKKILLSEQSYGETDQFYKATGSYTLLNTCNTWANEGFKQSGLKASYWTPFHFGLLSKYQ